MQRYFEIQQALLASNGVIWDDHNGGFESKLAGLAALVNGDKVIAVGLHKSDYFSLNRVYLKDGKVHLGVESVGGVLFPINHRDLWECINDYNEKQIGNRFSCGTLENVMSMDPVPVTVISLTIGEFNAKNQMRLLDEHVRGVCSPDKKVIHQVTLDTGERLGVLEDVIDGKVKVKGIPHPDTQNLHLSIRDTEVSPDLVEKVEAGDTKAAGALLPRVRSLNADYLNPDDEMAQDAYHRRLLADKDKS